MRFGTRPRCIIDKPFPLRDGKWECEYQEKTPHPVAPLPEEVRNKLFPEPLAMTDSSVEWAERIKKAIAEQNAIKENFIARYLAATGAKIDETVLVEERSSDMVTIGANQRMI